MSNGLNFTGTCVWCQKPAVFTDEERGEFLLLCPNCLTRWQEMVLINDIMAGRFQPKLPAWADPDSSEEELKEELAVYWQRRDQPGDRQILRALIGRLRRAALDAE